MANAKVPNLKDISGMFVNSQTIKKIDFSNINFENLENISYAFL
jgi:hypothetical protein